MHDDSEFFGRTALVAGDEMMTALADTRVLVFGIGGVGSWCVEALARSAIGHITIVDSDTVAPSNINRQMPALASTVGQPKVEVIARRIADINPGAAGMYGFHKKRTLVRFAIDKGEFKDLEVIELADNR